MRARHAIRSLFVAVVLVGVVFSSSAVFAQALQVSAGATKKKVPWRGSAITLINTVSLPTFIPDINMSKDPYYGISMMLMPRWWFTKNLYARMLMFLDLELTDANNRNGNRRVTFGDTFFDWVWSDSRLTIPGIKVRVTPSLRFLLPTSSFVYNRNLVLGIGPGVGMGRGFKLRKGKWFTRFSIGYGFRVVKEFHRFNTVSTNELAGCVTSPTAGPDASGCTQTGGLNRSWRILNAVSGSLSIHPKLTLSGTVFFINDILYGMKEQGSLPNNPNVSVPSAGTFSRPALMWTMVSLTYAAASWAYIGLGVQSFHSVRRPDSKLYVPLFNRSASFYLALTVPIVQLTDALFGGTKNTKKKVSRNRRDNTRPQS